jgi:RNA polymerase sigma-70 factor, ECF subfamily
MSNSLTPQFEANRGLMFSIAYRMLGSASEAEDILQEAYLRYRKVDPETVTSPKAFLSTIVTRLCLNQLQASKREREVYAGPWLPEPLLTFTEEQQTPAQKLELNETLSLAFLTLLEDLSPAERAVFLLREVFDYDYGEIAEIVGKDGVACRQLLSRAKKHIAGRRPRFKPTREAHREILQKFIQAIDSGELSELTELLTNDVTLWADGGGKTRGALLEPLTGQPMVARFLKVSPRFRAENLHTEYAEINREPAAIVWAGSEVVVVITISIEQGLIREIRVVGNPDKLKWASQSIEASKGKLT